MMTYIVAAGIRFRFLIRGGRRRAGVGGVASDSAGKALSMEPDLEGSSGSDTGYLVGDKKDACSCKGSVLRLACDLSES